MRDGTKIVVNPNTGETKLIVKEGNKTTVTSNHISLTEEGLTILTAMTTFLEVGPFLVVKSESRIQKI